MAFSYSGSSAMAAMVAVEGDETGTWVWR